MLLPFAEQCWGFTDLLFHSKEIQMCELGAGYGMDIRTDIRTDVRTYMGTSQALAVMYRPALGNHRDVPAQNPGSREGGAKADHSCCS